MLDSAMRKVIQTRLPRVYFGGRKLKVMGDTASDRRTVTFYLYVTPATRHYKLMELAQKLGCWKQEMEITDIIPALETMITEKEERNENYNVEDFMLDVLKRSRILGWSVVDFRESALDVFPYSFLPRA